MTILKSNYKQRLKSLEESRREQAGDVVKRIWEISAILTLHREFGFGAERLKRFAKALLDAQSEFMTYAAATDPYDRKKRELSNIDTALIRMIRELRTDGIDHRDIFGDGCEIIMTDENGKQDNLDDFVERVLLHKV